MTTEQFGQTYLQHETTIIKMLRKLNIYDEDLLHDTYIALYEYAPHPSAEEFATTFVKFYKNLHEWQNNKESLCESYDHNQLAALHIIDESDWRQRELKLHRLDKLLRYYFTHPQPDERDHKRSCKILRLFLKGLSETEISYKLKISQQAVSKSIIHSIDRLKGCTSHIV